MPEPDDKGREPVPRPRRVDPHKITTHPTRRAILAIFEADRDLEASAVDLFRHADLGGSAEQKLSTVNYHCSILERGGLLEEVRRGQVRGAVKRTLGLTENGRAYLDGQGGILVANVVLDKIAAVLRESKWMEDTLVAIQGLVESTGRDIGAGA
jgi:hypothetical protein